MEKEKEGKGRNKEGRRIIGRDRGVKEEIEEKRWKGEWRKDGINKEILKRETSEIKVGY